MNPVFATVQWLDRYKERIAILGVGIMADRVICYTFDFVLYPFVIWYCGLLRGGAIMAILSLVVCLLTIKFYDWAKKDWLGIEAIKELKTYEGTGHSGRILRWLLCRSDPAACVFLSIICDPFITMAYLREGKYNGMSSRDWKYFFLSWFIGNVYWSLAAFMGISVVEWVWRVVAGTMH